MPELGHKSALIRLQGVWGVWGWIWRRSNSKRSGTRRLLQFPCMSSPLSVSTHFSVASRKWREHTSLSTCSSSLARVARGRLGVSHSVRPREATRLRRRGRWWETLCAVEARNCVSTSNWTQCEKCRIQQQVPPAIHRQPAAEQERDGDPPQRLMLEDPSAAPKSTSPKLFTVSRPIFDASTATPASSAPKPSASSSSGPRAGFFCEWVQRGFGCPS